MGQITQLKAVNHMLLHAGSSPVSDLLGASGVDTGIALDILDEASMDYQMRGIVNNQNVVKLTPDETTGLILLPSGGDGDDNGIIHVELLSRHFSSEFNIQIRIRVNDGLTAPKLFNVTDDTEVFTDSEYRVRYTKDLKWESLDTVAQRAIMARAARIYQMYLQGDDEADRYLAEQELIYKARLVGEDIYDRERNIFFGQSSLRAFNPFRRFGGRYYGNQRYPRT